MNGDYSSIIDFGIKKSNNKFYNNTSECYFLFLYLKKEEGYF